MATRSEIISTVKEMIQSAMGIPVERINLTDDLSYDLSMGSYDKMFLLSEIQDELGIFFPDDALDRFRTVEDLVDAIMELID